MSLSDLLVEFRVDRHKETIATRLYHDAIREYFDKREKMVDSLYFHNPGALAHYQKHLDARSREYAEGVVRNYLRVVSK